MAAKSNSTIANKIVVSQLECHFKWFNQLNNESNGEWLSRLLNKQLHNDLRIEDEDSELENGETVVAVDKLSSKRLELLSWRFTLVLRNTFEKKFSEAWEIATDLLEVEEAKNSSQPQVHIDTYSYVVLSNQLNILEQWRSSSDCPVNENVNIEIAAKMEPLVNSVKTNEGKAFVSGMKCNLSRDMGDDKIRADFAKKATELNPQSVDWHQSLYLALRKIRRSIDFCQRPSQEEIDACTKASELEESVSLGNAIVLAKMYSELLIHCRRERRDYQVELEQALKFARMAVRMRPHSKILKMRLATLLSGNRIYNGYAEAKKLVEEVEIGNCSSGLCHKIGKFYSTHPSNKAKALEWFERGLEADVGNFPCLMEMLRNSIFQLKPTTEIIQTIDNVLNSISNRNFKCQLMFVKGLFVWTIDHDEAIDLWLQAMNDDVDSKINFVSIATYNCCFVKNKNLSLALQMMEDVKSFMYRRLYRKESTNSGDNSFTKLKQVVDSVIDYFNTQFRKTQYTRLNRTSTSGSTQQNSNYGNWRK